VVVGQHEASVALSPRKTRNPLYRKLGVLRGQGGLRGEPRHTDFGSLDSLACRESCQLRYPGRIYIYIYKIILLTSRFPSFFQGEESSMIFQIPRKLHMKPFICKHIFVRVKTSLCARTEDI